MDEEGMTRMEIKSNTDKPTDKILRRNPDRIDPKPKLKRTNAEIVGGGTPTTKGVKTLSRDSKPDAS